MLKYKYNLDGWLNNMILNNDKKEVEQKIKQSNRKFAVNFYFFILFII